MPSRLLSTHSSVPGPVTVADPHAKQAMKEFKLAAWPELPATFHRTVYRRMLSDMSHRYMSVPQLLLSSGATKMEVRQFMQMLQERGLLREREGEDESIFDSLRPLSDWFKRTINGPEIPKD
jgi:hypothetical protein